MKGIKTMGEKYIMAVDGGTQSTKVLIFDVKGNVVAEGRQKLRPMIAPEPRYQLHPDDDLWDSFVAACKMALEGFKGDPKDIAGVGLCTIRCCRVIMKEDGSLAYPVIDWMDPRAYGPCDFPTSDFNYLTTTTGYFTKRLTGEFRDTAANNLYWQCPTDPVTWLWSDDDSKFDAFNMKRSQMTELCMPSDVLGQVTGEASVATGIPEGIPVIATANDKAVEALGTGLMLGNLGLISLGTYSTGMMPADRLIMDNPVAFWSNFGCIPHRYLLETRRGIHRGMWTVSWLSELLGGNISDEVGRRGVSVLELLNEEAAQVPAGSHGLITIPEWLVLNTNQPFKKGIMIGFDVRHGRAHMFRSLLEGIILKLYNGFSNMCNEAGIFPERLIASGGGSKGDTFVQIIADVFGLPVTRNEIEDAAGTGSAICAAVATGIYPDFDAAAKAMVRVKDTFQPNMENHTVYKRLNDEVFRDFVKSTDPILEKTYEIFG